MRLPHPQMGTTVYNASPYRVWHLSAKPTRHAPLLGEHTAAVLPGDLGVPAADLPVLRGQGVI